MALTLFKGLTKLTVGGAAVYVTVSQGVWNNSQEASLAADRVKSSVLPAANVYGQKIKQASCEFGDSIPKKWNSGVQTAFGAIANSPEYGKKAVTYTKDLVKKLN